MNEPLFEKVFARLADALEGINEKMGRFVTAIEKSSKDNDKWMDGRVSIDARTHTALLEAVQKLSGQFDKWFESQHAEREFFAPSPAAKLYWSNEDGWVVLNMADAFTSDEKALYGLPVGGEWLKTIDDMWVIQQEKVPQMGAGHDMDRCNKHHAHNCVDCHPMPEDAEERK